MADKGKGKMIDEESSSNSSSPSRMDTMLAFVTSTDEKERRRTNNNEREDYEVHKDKRCSCEQCFVPMEIWKQLEPLPAELLDEVEVVPAPKADNNNNCEKVDAGSCRGMPKEEDNGGSKYIRKTSTTTFQCLQGTSSTSTKYQEEYRMIQGCQHLKKDRQYYDEPKKQIKKTRKQCLAVKRQRAASLFIQPAPAPKRKRAAAQLVLPAPQPVPDNIRDAIRDTGGVDIMWVSEKVLTKSDTRSDQNRLLLPSDCYDFLQSIMADDEKIEFFESTSHRLHIKLVDQNKMVWDMDLTYWPTTQWRVFTKNWNKFVKNLDMVPEKDKVQIWCFRIPAQGMRLCFAINIVRPSAPEAAPEPGAIPAPEAAQGPDHEAAP